MTKKNKSIFASDTHWEGHRPTVQLPKLVDMPAWHAGTSDRSSAAALPLGRPGRPSSLAALPAAACELTERHSGDQHQ